jgi:hypothetical protein
MFGSNMEIQFQYFWKCWARDTITYTADEIVCQ